MFFPCSLVPLGKSKLHVLTHITNLLRVLTHIKTRVQNKHSVVCTTQYFYGNSKKDTNVEVTWGERKGLTFASEALYVEVLVLYFEHLSRAVASARVTRNGYVERERSIILRTTVHSTSSR